MLRIPSAAAALVLATSLAVAVNPAAAQKTASSTPSIEIHSLERLVGRNGVRVLEGGDGVRADSVRFRVNLNLKDLTDEFSIQNTTVVLDALLSNGMKSSQHERATGSGGGVLGISHSSGLNVGLSLPAPPAGVDFRSFEVRVVTNLRKRAVEQIMPIEDVRVFRVEQVVERAVEQ